MSKDQEEHALRVLYAVLDDAYDGVQYGRQTVSDADVAAVGILDELLYSIERQISGLRENLRLQIGSEAASRISAAVSEHAEGSSRWLDEIATF